MQREENREWGQWPQKYATKCRLCQGLVVWIRYSFIHSCYMVTQLPFGFHKNDLYWYHEEIHCLVAKDLKHRIAYNFMGPTVWSTLGFHPYPLISWLCPGCRSSISWHLPGYVHKYLVETLKRWIIQGSKQFSAPWILCKKSLFHAWERVSLCTKEKLAQEFAEYFVIQRKF